MKYWVFSILFLSCIISWAKVSIIPTPQQIKWGKVLKIDSDKVKINFPLKGFKAEILARAILQNKVKLAIKSPVLIIDLKFGKVSSNVNAYTIDYSVDKTITTVTITAKNSRALFYGLMTFEQLLQKNDNGKISLHLAKVLDYPFWKNRFLGNYSLFTENNLKKAAKYKFGGLAFQYRDEWQKLSPKSSFYQKKFALTKKYSQYDVLDFMLVYHIYASRGPRSRAIFNIASEKDIAGLIERCHFAASNGISQIMICADDWTPMKNGIYICPNKEERDEFGECAGRAHGVLMTRLYNALGKSFPKLKFSFCPPVYSLEGHAAESPKMAAYLSDLVKNLPFDVSIVWTGNHIVSHKIIREHYQRFSKLLAGHKTMIWDNSDCYVYPIHSWKTIFFSGLEKVSSGIFINGKAFDGGLWKNLYAINANDYLWNPEQYNNSSSYKKIFKRFFPKKDYELVQDFQNNFEKLAKMNCRNYDKKLLAKFKQQKIDIDRTINADRWIKYPVNKLINKLESSRPVTEIKLIPKPPLIDGKDTDKCYQELIENVLVERYGKKVPDSRKTTFKIAFNREAIYIFLKAKLSKPLQDKKSLNPSVDLFSSADILEIFISPTSNRKYIQIAFDFKGNKYSRLTKKRDWNPHWKLKIIKNNQYWCAEVAIPFKMLEDAGAKPPSDKVQWRGNICREYNAAKDLQCWSPTFTNRFLESAMFGYFEFKE